MKTYFNRKGRRAYGPKTAFVLSLLPYGQWTCADGREVLFDRDYAPICERHNSGIAKVANPREWIEFVKQEHFYNDFTSDAEKRKMGLAKLQEWNIREAVMADIEKLC